VPLRHDQEHRTKEQQYGNLLAKFRVESEQKRWDYPIRPLWMLDYCPGFRIGGRHEMKFPVQHSLVSIPVYAKMARLRLEDVPMQRLLVRLKDPNNRAHIKLIRDAI